MQVKIYKWVKPVSCARMIRDYDEDGSVDSHKLLIHMVAIVKWF